MDNQEHTSVIINQISYLESILAAMKKQAILDQSKKMIFTTSQFQHIVNKISEVTSHIEISSNGNIRFRLNAAIGKDSFAPIVIISPMEENPCYHNIHMDIKFKTPNIYFLYCTGIETEDDILRYKWEQHTATSNNTINEWISEKDIIMSNNQEFDKIIDWLNKYIVHFDWTSFNRDEISLDSLGLSQPIDE